MFILLIFFTFEIEYYGEMNNFLLKIMMEEFSLFLMLLCVEIILFIRFHLLFVTQK